MGRLIYSMLTSLDGYVADAAGDFDWSVPDEELHAYINEESRSVGTYLLGRRMYETMLFWETAEDLPGVEQTMLDFAHIWRAADKIVYSTTLIEVSSERTRIERDFDPVAIRAMKADSEWDIAISGPTLAAQALLAGVVDEIGQYVCPVTVGGGKAFYPPGLHLDLELRDDRPFAGGVSYLRYAVLGAPSDRTVD